jgi:hypothetical protein
MSKALTLSTDPQALVEIEKLDVVRYLSKQANVSRKERVAKFAHYVGSDGVGSTSPAGMVMFISSAIKRTFGCSVEEMNQQQLIALIGLEAAIEQIIDNGEKQQLPRSEIRQRIKDVIELTKHQYDIIKG